MAVDVLLALSENLPELLDDELEENANLMPIGGETVPALGEPDYGDMKQDVPIEDNTAKTTQTEDDPTSTTADVGPIDDSVSGVKPKSTHKKGTFTMKSHSLPKPSADPRKFRCPFDGCK